MTIKIIDDYGSVKDFPHPNSRIGSHTVKIDHPGILSCKWVWSLGRGHWEIEVPDEMTVKLVDRNYLAPNQIGRFDGVLAKVVEISKTPFCEWHLVVDCTEGLAAVNAPQETYDYANGAYKHLGVFVSGDRSLGTTYVAILPDQEPAILEPYRDKWNRMTSRRLDNYHRLWNVVDVLCITVMRRIMEAQYAAEDRRIQESEDKE